MSDNIGLGLDVDFVAPDNLVYEYLDLSLARMQNIFFYCEKIPSHLWGVKKVLNLSN